MKKHYSQFRLLAAIAMAMLAAAEPASAAEKCIRPQVSGYSDEEVGCLIDGLAPIAKMGTNDGEGSYGFADATGKIVVPPQYDYACAFSEGMACVQKNRQWGYIDTTGKEVIPLQYERAFDFSEGLVGVSLTSTQWGHVDKTGKIVVPLEYDRVRNFEDGMAAVKKGDKWGYVDTTGQLVIPPQYIEANYFRNGSAYVKTATKVMKIDKQGNEK